MVIFFCTSFSSSEIPLLIFDLFPVPLFVPFLFLLTKWILFLRLPFPTLFLPKDPPPSPKRWRVLSLVYLCSNWRRLAILFLTPPQPLPRFVILLLSILHKPFPSSSFRYFPFRNSFTARCSNFDKHFVFKGRCTVQERVLDHQWCYLGFCSFSLRPPAPPLLNTSISLYICWLFSRPPILLSCHHTIPLIRSSL